MSKDLLNISPKIKGYFLCKGQDKDNVFLEHIASGKRFNLTKKSLDYLENFEKLDSIVNIGIVRWKGEWWFSGLYFKIDFDADLILEEKNSFESRASVRFLDYDDDEKLLKETLQLQFETFKRFTNGKQIIFVPPNKTEELINEFTVFYNRSLKLSKREKEESEERMRKEGYLKTDKKIEIDFSKDSDSALIFFNPNRGIEIATSVNSAFPLPHNKYFNEKDSKKHIMRLFLDEGLSKELVMYCVDNCRTKIPFFKSEEGKILLKDLDFLLRFWKNRYYHTVPTIMFIGK